MHLEGRHVLVVGGGEVGLRKTEGLVEAGALVTVASVGFAEGFGTLAVERVVGAYESAVMERRRFVLVFAATNVMDVNARVAADAAARGILCCRCDGHGGGGGGSDFSGMATARVGGITVGVSTASGSPAVAAAVRDRVAGAVDPAWGQLAEFMAGWRARARAEVADGAARRALLQRLGTPEMVEAVRRGEGEALFERWLAAAREAGGGGGSAVQ